MSTTNNNTLYPSQLAVQQEQQQQGNHGSGPGRNSEGYVMVSQSQNSAAPVSNADDTSRDEKLARELQARYNAGQVVIAQPVNPQLPFNCGSCGTTHSVRNAAHGSQFKCTVCGAMNRIMTQQNSMVVVDNAYPIPIFCSIQ